jgi:hypothetical protein
MKASFFSEGKPYGRAEFDTIEGDFDVNHTFFPAMLPSNPYPKHY